MAKKGQPAQLQIDVTTDEEWEKLLQRDGLILVDIYSEWCGPCLGMQASLKKIKLELGGDMLILAIAKSDGISALARFRNKSEPTWMFLSKGKMVNLMFGADAPKLTRLIIDELKKEQLQAGGQATDRSPMEVTEMAEEEKVRYEVVEHIQKEIREKEERKRAKELLERRTKECENILFNLPNFGTALIFPSAKDKYKEVLNEILDEAGLVIQQTEKIQLDEDCIKELCYFTDISAEFSEQSLEELLNKESLMLLLKISPKAELEDIDDAILNMIYGNTKHPPGVSECVARQLITVEEETEEQDFKEFIGIWAPLTTQVRATSLRIFFPKVTKDFELPEPEPEPEHVAIIFPISKKDEVVPIMQEYPNQIMKYGFFTSDKPEDAKLVAKTLKKLEKLDPSERTYSENIVLQVSKQKSECVFAFAQLEPLYMSPNTKEGKAECEKFFPEVEGEVVEEEEEEEEEVAEEIQEGVEEGAGLGEGEEPGEDEIGNIETGKEEDEIPKEGEETNEEGTVYEGEDMPVPEGETIEEGAAELPSEAPPVEE